MCIRRLVPAGGTVAVILYALAVAPEARTSLDLAILVFTGAAALTGYLGIIVGWLSYRLEAGKVPKPGLAIIDRGRLVARWEVEIELLPPDPDVSAEVAAERTKLERSIATLEESTEAKQPPAGSGLFSSWAVREVNAEDIANYRKRVETYLRKYERYIKERRLREVFWARSKQVVFAFTNERAGVPVEGLRAIIRVPTDNDLHVLPASDIPEDLEAPTPPALPQRRSILDLGMPAAFSVFPPSLERTLGTLRDVRPQGNVSPPTIRPGSTVIEFSVKEVLHNLHEDTREDPLILLFNRAGIWKVPFELHARNLPAPIRGELVLEARVKPPDLRSSAAPEPEDSEPKSF
jgi:hypothetical protein